MLEILVGAERQLGVGQEAARFGHRVADRFDVHEVVHLLAGDFLFVKRAQDQQRGAVVLEGLRDVDVVAERARADDQRMRQPHPEIGRAQVHHSSLSPPPGMAASNAGTLMPASCEYTRYRRSAAFCDSSTNALYCAGLARSTMRNRDSLRR